MSGRGSNLQSLLEKCGDGSIPASVSVVISNRPGAKALDRAVSKGVPTFTIEPRHFGKWPACKESYERRLVETLSSFEVELLVLAGYDRLVGDTLLDAFPMKVINIHPALLPAFPGLNAQKQALDYGVKVAGASVFFVDASVDGGPIIIQESCKVMDDDTLESLSWRILEIEHRILPEAVRLIAQGKIRVHGRKVVVSPHGR